MIPTPEIEFLGMVINSKNMNFSLPWEKLEKIKIQCLDLYKSSEVSILQLTKILGHLPSTVQQLLPARRNRCFLQQQQIQFLKKKGSFQENMSLKQKLGRKWNISKLELLAIKLALQTFFKTHRFSSFLI